VRFCRSAGLLGGEWVAIDGSKFRAVASNEKAVTRKRLKEEQLRLEERVAQYLADLDRSDREEGETHLREEQLKAALEALERNAGALQLMEEQGLAQHIEGEPEAKLMHTRAGTQAAYNVQTAVDAKHAVVVAHDVTSEATDNRSLEAMAKAAKKVLGVESLKVAADAGYSSGEQAAACEAAGIEPFVPPNRSDTPGGGAFFSKIEFKYDADSDTYRCPANQLLVRKQLMRKERAVLYTTGACGKCRLRRRCTSGRQRHVMRHLFEDALQRLKKRVEEHPEAMRLRCSTVEHPFGTLKYQIFGHPRFLLRGRWGAGSEMALGILAYNLKRALAVLGVEGFRQKLAASPS
jgi:hypothetical protein